MVKLGHARNERRHSGRQDICFPLVNVDSGSFWKGALEQVSVGPVRSATIDF